MKNSIFIFLSISIILNGSLFSQEEDKSKMVREVVNIEMERPAKTEPEKKVVESNITKKGRNNNVEEEAIPEEEIIDTLSPTVPASVAELKKRAEFWYNAKNVKFSKSGGGVGANVVNCLVNFYFKPKELNPKFDIEGEISMNVTIDWKEGKYRYTIDKIEHKAKRGVSSGGDVFEKVPACGSMKLDDITWKQVKSTALENAKSVANDIKAIMAKSVKTENKDDW